MPSNLGSIALRIDILNHQVFVDGKPVHLAPREFELLACLAQSNGRVVRHEELLRRVWGDSQSQNPINLRTYIKQLRSRLEDDSTEPRFIQTVPRIGYRFLQASVMAGS